MFKVTHFRFDINTGKSLSEAPIFASTNPQYDNRLFIELQVQYMKIQSSNLGRTCCVQKLFLTFKTIFIHNMFSPCSAKIRASDKDSPVLFKYLISTTLFLFFKSKANVKKSNSKSFSSPHSVLLLQKVRKMVSRVGFEDTRTMGTKFF